MKLIDSDKLKTTIMELIKDKERGLIHYTGVMAAIDVQDGELIPCYKCHGTGKKIVPHIDEFDANKDEWAIRECELCKGTGKITVEFYEWLQSQMGGARVKK